LTSAVRRGCGTRVKRKRRDVRGVQLLRGKRDVAATDGVDTRSKYASNAVRHKVNLKPQASNLLDCHKAIESGVG